MFGFLSRRAAPTPPPPLTPPAAPVVVSVVVPPVWVPGEWSLNEAVRRHSFDDSRRLTTYGALPRQSVLAALIEQAQADQEAALVASRCWS